MYYKAIKKCEEDTKAVHKRVNEISGLKESDTGLALPAHWDLAADKQVLQSTFEIYCKFLEVRSFAPTGYTHANTCVYLSLMRSGYYIIGPTIIIPCTSRTLLPSMHMILT